MVYSSVHTFSVKFPNEQLTAEAGCAVAIAASSVGEGTWSLHVSDQKRLVFIEKCLLISASFRKDIGVIFDHVSYSIVQCIIRYKVVVLALLVLVIQRIRQFYL